MLALNRAILESCSTFLCRECGFRDTLPLVGRCPVCRSRYIAPEKQNPPLERGVERKELQTPRQ